MNSSIIQFIHLAAIKSKAPPATDLKAAQQALSTLLLREMHRLGFWERPPAHLGMPWAQNWTNPQALEELLADCFTYTLLKPLAFLVELTRTRCAVDSLVAHSVGWFLTDSERLFDPLGDGIRKRFQTAVRGMVRRGSLHVMAGDPRVDFSTRLSFAPDAGQDLPSQNELRTATALWPEALMPDLIIARGSQRKKLTEDLQGCLGDLSHYGIESFRLVDLSVAFRHAVEEQWRRTATTFHPSQRQNVPNLEIPRFFRQRQRFRAFLECVGDSIDHLTTDQGTHGHLSLLWMFLRDLAQRVESPSNPSELLEHHLTFSADQNQPACSTLRRLLGFCTGSADWDSPAPPPDLSLTTQLLKETRNAQVRISAAEDTNHSPSLAGLCPGRFFVARTAATEQLVIWLVASTNQAADRLHVVPVDPFPLVGSHDLPLEIAGLGHLRLRCGFELEIPARLDEFAHLLTPLPTTVLAPNDLDRIARHRHRLANGKHRHTITTDDVDSDPAMEDWIDQVLTPSRRGLETLFSPSSSNSVRLDLVDFNQRKNDLQPFLSSLRRPTKTNFIALALLLLLALAIFIHCGQQASGQTQPPPPNIATEEYRTDQCGTLHRTQSSGSACSR